MMLCVQGNYDAYVKTRHELEEHQMKRYHWERNQMQHMKVTLLLSSVIVKYCIATGLHRKVWTRSVC